jgi:hypothetical protein
MIGHPPPRKGEVVKNLGIGFLGLSVALYLFESVYSLGNQATPSLDSPWLWLHVLLWSMSEMYYPFMVVAAFAGAILILMGLVRKD